MSKKKKNEKVTIRTRRERITPKKAEEWLERNGDNRPISEPHVDMLASSIMEGEWVLNGETIKFNEDGDLRDGQHRLHAVLRTKKSIDSFVTYGLPSGCFDTIDRGRSRNNSDLLARKGHVQTVVLASALAWLWRDTRFSLRVTSTKGRPRGTQIMILAEDHSGMIDSVRKAKNSKKLVPHSVGSFCHYQFSLIDSDLADELFDKLGSGEGMKKGQPEHTLRERLLDNKGKSTKMRMITMICLIRKTWNAMRNQKPMRSLRWALEEQIPEVL